MKKPSSRFIYITGADGTGKTTQRTLLVKHLHSQGVEVQSLWLRFPFIFSLPILAYARLRRFSWQEEVGGVRYGYWNFNNSNIMRRIFPWVYWLDATIASIFFVRLPLFLGRTIICERFVLDMLADLIVGLDDTRIIQASVGKMFIRLIPKDSEVVILDLSADEIRVRRPELHRDRMLESRLSAYRHIVEISGYKKISSQASIKVVHERIRKILGVL